MYIDSYVYVGKRVLEVESILITNFFSHSLKFSLKIENEKCLDDR